MTATDTGNYKGTKHRTRLKAHLIALITAAAVAIPCYIGFRILAGVLGGFTLNYGTASEYNPPPSKWEPLINIVGVGLLALVVIVYARAYSKLRRSGREKSLLRRD